MAGETLFQMDQKTSSYQKFLWNPGERSKDSNLDCRLRYGGYSEKTTSAPLKSLHYSTGSERLGFRKNRALSAIYDGKPQNGKPYDC